jgi:uncharacterized protein YdaU (DUF1376 family)
VSAAPWFKFYPNDFLGETQLLTDGEAGTYVRLMCAMWNAGGALPLDHAALARMAHKTPRAWTSMWARLEPFFTVEGRQFTHKFLTEERLRVQEKLAQTSAAGKASVESKSLKSQHPASTDVGTNAATNVGTSQNQTQNQKRGAAPLSGGARGPSLGDPSSNPRETREAESAEADAIEPDVAGLIADVSRKLTSGSRYPAASNALTAPVFEGPAAEDVLTDERRAEIRELRARLNAPRRPVSPWAAQR